MQTCTDETRSETWLKAARLLLDADERIYNLIVEVERPELATPRSRAIERTVDSFLAKSDCQSIHTVAETIFPAVEYRSGGLKGVYDYQDTIFPVIKKIHANSKGTYAYRLVCRHTADGGKVNPLETAIDKLRGQLTKSGPLRAVYELDLNIEALELKLYDVHIDDANLRGGQCLSHVSLKLGPNRELYLTALYRYQYFVQKALGNLKGLARLQACIARELEIPVGPLVCHATLAILEDTRVAEPWKRAELVELVETCEAIEQEHADVAEAVA